MLVQLLRQGMDSIIAVFEIKREVWSLNKPWATTATTQKQIIHITYFDHSCYMATKEPISFGKEPLCFTTKITATSLHQWPHAYCTHFLI